MSTSKTVTQQFSDDFEAVAAYYNLRQLGEYEAAKTAARANIGAAIATFSKLADEVREGTA